MPIGDLAMHKQLYETPHFLGSQRVSQRGVEKHLNPDYPLSSEAESPIICGETSIAMFRLYALVTLIFVGGPHLHPAYAQPVSPYRNSIVIKVIPLNYADAEHLASVLSPLLTKDGTIVAHAPTNTLIIKDRRSVVGELVRVIKGPGKAKEPFLNCQDGPPKSRCMSR